MRHMFSWLLFAIAIAFTGVPATAGTILGTRKMVNHPTRTRKLINVLRLLAVLCFTFGLAVSAAAQCSVKNYTLDVPDTATLRLSDGEHAIAAVQTDQGKLEARVTVQGGKVVSGPWFFLSGQLLRPISQAELQSRLPEPLRHCAQNRSSSSESWFGDAASCVLDWIVPEAHAVNRCVWTFQAVCYKNADATWVCWIHGCCGRTCEDSIESVK